MTIDCNKSGPEMYRTKAGNNFEQFCYFYQYKKDRLFNKFLAKRVDENNNSLVFKIDSAINTTKNGETKIHSNLPSNLNSLIENTLEDKKNGRRPRLLL